MSGIPGQGPGPGTRPSALVRSVGSKDVRSTTGPKQAQATSEGTQVNTQEAKQPIATLAAYVAIVIGLWSIWKNL